MLNIIRNKLILLYTLSTGIILTAVLIFVTIITGKQLMLSRKASFQNNYITVNQNLQMNNEISQLWLAELETKNHLIINIEDNGKPLLYTGAWRAPSDRQQLVEKVKQLALRDGISTSFRPASLKKVQSDIYMLRGSENDRYYGEVFVTPAGADGYRSIVMLQYISGGGAGELIQKLLIVLIDLLGVTALLLVSRWIVGQSLKPVAESRRRQTEFIASASHELKSPLAVIQADASALLIEPDRAEHYSKCINKECRRLSALIEDMLLLASADAGSWRLKKELIDMDTLLIETCDNFYQLFKENGKELKLELPEEILPGVEGDSSRLRQILAVLLDNAVTYSMDKDSIIMRAFKRKSHLIIEVEDHGPGIAPDRKPDIFERFYRADRSRKDKNHYGLGLSIAKELAELHGGSISIKDTPGGGATFTVILPSAPKA